MLDELPPVDSPDWPDARDQTLFAVLDVNLTALDIKPFEYQRDFLLPPPPYRYQDLKLILFGGAKRIGKSYILSSRATVTPFVPGYTTRLYGFQHENCEREFRHIKRMLIDESNPHALCHLHPELRSELVEFNDNPRDEGALIMKWSWGSEILSRSWQQNNQWVGEPIDLAIVCEPGLLPFARAYSAKIKPNLMDRRGVCIAAGTVDDASMKSYHDLAHDHANSPDIFCVCEVPQWANSTLPEYKDRESAKLYIAQCQREMTPRDFAINILGQWENYAGVAYPMWAPNTFVKTVSRRDWQDLKAIPANCDHFLVLDTGKHCAAGQYIITPSGKLLMIDEFTNYAYRAGNILLTDQRGFKSWFADVLDDIKGRLSKYQNMPYVIGDPSSQFKNDVYDLGLGFVDAVNAHDYGVNALNEYLSKHKFVMVRPEGRPPYLAETELSRVRWAETVTGIQGRHKLIKGDDDDHSADQVRYAAASRALGLERQDEKKKTIVDLDDEWEMNRHDRTENSMFADSPTLGGGIL